MGTTCTWWKLVSASALAIWLGAIAPGQARAAAAAQGDEPVRLDLAAEWRAQLADLMAAIADRRRQPPAEEVLRRDAMILPADRDPVDVVLRRTEALLADVRRLGPTRDLSAEQAELARLRSMAEQLPPMEIVVTQPASRSSKPPREPRKPPKLKLPKPRAGLKSFAGEEPLAGLEPLAPKADKPKPEPGPLAEPPQQPQPAPESSPAARPDPTAREALYMDLCRLRRQIALANPLLSFDQLLFLKTRRSRPGHCCDQFFGVKVGSSGPTGGVYVLHDPFGPRPTLRNVLAESAIRNGRSEGRKLEDGSFLSPDVSWDGEVITFAHTLCKVTQAVRTLDSRAGIWDPNGSYHLFRVRADGGDLRQLTDGGFNDFDPAWLPNGRIVFITERRGGYGRCHGRPVPIYTLHSMNADGSDIVPISYHETNEWNPSVNHDGMIVYTRWDYVDRGDCIAHHPWVTAPDGRDSRSIQGNFPSARRARPDTEHDLRAIPGSRRYVATAAAHHGQSFGSLVLLDPDVEDDGAMAPLKRVTPDNGFPETQGGRAYYGTPWPLSEDYYLCVYGGQRHKDAVYLVDSFGNHVLIYLDPGIECLSPMPLAARPRPPVLPHATAVGKPSGPPMGPSADAGRENAEGVVACINIYDGLMPWPEGTKITELRVIQLFPKATPSMDRPKISRWAESLCRGVLGTVPVEADGSAYFRVPAGKTLYFQVLDANGLAVQSMQSDTYLHPGERLTCQGCHEHRYRSPGVPATVPLALRRPPSTIRAEVDGAYPVSFPRLVQPVLDRKCVPCHKESRKAPDLTASVAESLQARRAEGWTQSYKSLSSHAFGRSGKPPSREDVRTVPGEFGAKASHLYKMLAAGHNKVDLTPEELRRITLWLDCNSNFFGAYFEEDKQIRGELVMPNLH
ncbi:MAG TPA: hypothetical protein VM695_12915 [Phycisphaerae bacterium]|nr:hypothetical protein [Phycisphaerae bacterium]